MKQFISAILAMWAGAAMAAGPWMGQISDDAYAHQLSIPGTHDSGTGNGTSLDIFARTQDLGIGEQFDAGIRAFDMRPAYDGNKLQIYHGAISTKISFAEAMETLWGRLEANPSEFVIVVMRHESDIENDANKAAWSTEMASYLAQLDADGRLANFKPDLTVGELRGKILIFSRDRYGATTPYGAYVDGWSHGGDFSDQSHGTLTRRGLTSPLWVQDFYETYGKMDTKFSAITTMLDHSTQLTDSDTHTWVINHTSGYYNQFISSADGYRQNAESTNKAVIDYLADPTKTAGPTGIIVMDFAGVDTSSGRKVLGQSLIDAVIDNNNRYQMRSSAPEVAAESDVLSLCGGEISCVGPINVYTPAGALVASANGSVSLSAPGLYILHTLAGARKICVK